MSKFNKIGANKKLSKGRYSSLRRSKEQKTRLHKYESLEAYLSPEQREVKIKKKQIVVEKDKLNQLLYDQKRLDFATRV